MTDKTEVYKALAALVTYDPETGIITWNRREELTRGDKYFNTRFSGHECGSIETTGYRRINLTYKSKVHKLSAHQLAFLITNGRIPDGEVDHINRDRVDNRACNLRDVPIGINHKNKSMRTDNASGITGVSWDKARGKWRACVYVGGRRQYSGYFTHIHEAEAAVKAFRAKHGFTDSHGEQS